MPRLGGSTRKHLVPEGRQHKTKALHFKLAKADATIGRSGIWLLAQWAK